MSTEITDIGNNFLLLNPSDEFYYYSLTAYIVLCVIINLYLIIPPCFVWLFRNVNHIQTRNYALLLLQCFFCIILCNQWLGQIRLFGSIASRHTTFETAFGCASTFYLAYFFFPMLLLTFFMRAAQCVLSEAMSQSILRKLDGTGTLQRKKYRSCDRFVHQIFRYLMIREVYSRPDSSGTSATASPDTSQLFLTSRNNSEDFTMSKVNNFTVFRNYGALFLVEIALLLIAIVPNLGNIPYCNVLAMFMPLYALIVPAPFLIIPLLFVMRDVKDNFHIKFGLGFSFACMLVGAIFYFIAEFPIWIFGYTYIRGVTFLLVATLLVHSIDIVLPTYRAYRHMKQSGQGEKEGTDNMSLDQVINHPVLWLQFQQQVISDYAGENAQFINDYRKIMSKIKSVEESHFPHVMKGSLKIKTTISINSTDQLPSSTLASSTGHVVTPSHIHVMLQSMIRNYIAPGAPFELNISGKVRSSIMEEVKTGKAEGKLLTPDILEPVFKEVKKNLEMNSWPRFQATLRNRGSREIL
ncbi:hypothetical protein BKA69DRAFT_1080785 [Paraphysoderma sedebokerense]|nr:hypothetical protein BKA69DRAFT_1080785 [Paraphysoderma sedebokerense]